MLGKSLLLSLCQRENLDYSLQHDNSIIFTSHVHRRSGTAAWLARDSGNLRLGKLCQNAIQFSGCSEDGVRYFGFRPGYFLLIPIYKDNG